MRHPLSLFLLACCWSVMTLAAPAPPAILILGDSLSAAYGMARERGWPWLLEERLRARGLPYRVINASVSGETTAGGLTRLPSLLEEHRPAILVSALGANDGLRGLDPGLLRDHLLELIRQGQSAGSRTLLIGVRLPPNYGAAYTQGIAAAFQEAAAATGTPLLPDLLAGIAEDRALMQPDDLHPTAAAQPRILDRVWSALEPLLTH